MFDLGEFRESMVDEMWGDILDPRPGFEGEKTGIRFNVASPDSALFRDVENRVTDKNLNRAAKRNNRQPGMITLHNADIDAQRLEMLMGVILGWDGVVFSGQPLEFSVDNLRTILTDNRFRFIREQIQVFLDDRRNFFTK
jgi:hypothetical protein